MQGAGQGDATLAGATDFSVVLLLDVAWERSATIFAVRDLLTAQLRSYIRHCAKVNLHPHVQPSALNLCRASCFCCGLSRERSTPGSSLARSACARKI